MKTAGCFSYGTPRFATDTIGIPASNFRIMLIPTKTMRAKEKHFASTRPTDIQGPTSTMMTVYNSNKRPKNIQSRISNF